MAPARQAQDAYQLKAGDVQRICPTSGGGGIRTHGGRNRPQRFSRLLRDGLRLRRGIKRDGRFALRRRQARRREQRRYFCSSRKGEARASALPRSGAAHSQRRAELCEHVLFALAHALGVEAHEPTLLRSVGGVLRALHDPRAERLCLLGARLRAGDLVGADISSTISLPARAPRGLKSPTGFLRCSASPRTSRASAPVRSSRCSLDERVTNVTTAEASFRTSIGPPGSASVIAMPATIGERTRVAHSSSLKWAF